MKETNNKITKRQFVGTVVSNKLPNTVTVRVINSKLNPLYKKVVKQYRKHMAQTDIEGLNIGDKVRIMENRPLSKRKKWYVVEKLDK
ncbi:MAG: 30S ribosomal protein S17 [bacterium]